MRKATMMPDAVPPRLLLPADIPLSLQEDGGRLVPPGVLADAYRACLSAFGLLGRAVGATHTGATGGATDAETERHFCETFSGSCGRLQIAVLDPRGELGGASDALVRAASGGRLAVLDIPGGCGAATATLLGVVAELRRSGVVPRQPLDVLLVSGDKAPKAGEVAGDLLGRMADGLWRQGIVVRAIHVEWEMRDATSTTSLLHRWMTHAPDCRRHLVLVPNCSDFLKNNLAKAEDRLTEVFRWAAARGATVVWVEPELSPTKGLMAAVDKCKDLLATLGLSAKRDRPPTSHATCRHLLAEKGEHGTHVSLHYLRDPEAA